MLDNMPIVNREVERAIVERARTRGMSDEQIKQAVLKYRAEQPQLNIGAQPTAPQQAPAPQKTGLEKFSNTISAPFKAVNKFLGVDALTKTLAKPFGEVVASTREFRGEKAPEWTKDTRLASPEQLAVQKFGISPEAGAEAERLKQQGYQGAGVTDVLNVASLAPGGLLAKGAGTVAKTTTATAGASKFLPTLAKSFKEVAPSAAGYGAAYGAAGEFDNGGTTKDVLTGAAKGAGVGLLTGAALSGGGTVLGSTVRTGSRILNKETKNAAIDARRLSELDKLTKNYKDLLKLDNKNKERGINAPDIISKTDLLVGAVDENGTFDTLGSGKSHSEVRDLIKHGEDGKGGYESLVRDALEREGVRVSLSDVEIALRKAVDESGLEGASLDAAHAKVTGEINGLRRRADAGGTIALAKVHDAKVNKYDTVDYLNPGSKKADKAIARALKKVVENKSNDVRVKELNAELSKHYAVLGFLEKLHGKKVEGGRLGKYAARVIGSIAGSKFGPLGSLAMSEAAGTMQGKLMARKFSGKTGGKLVPSDLMRQVRAENKTPKPLIPENRRIGYAIKPPQPDTTRFLSQEEAAQGLKERGWQNVDQRLSSQESIPSGNKTIKQSAKTIAPNIPISERLAQLDTKVKLEDEIANRIEAFRQEAGLMADREGAGVVRRNVEDAAGNFQFQATNFSLNKAKGNMKMQAESAKKEAHRLLYDNDPDFRAIVDKKDEMLEQRTKDAVSSDEFLDLINEVDSEIGIAKYAKPYEQPKPQPVTPPASIEVKVSDVSEAPKLKKAQVIDELRKPATDDKTRAAFVENEAQRQVSEGIPGRSEILEKPLTLYHGTATGNVFDKFSSVKKNKGVGQNLYDQGDQIYLTETPESAKYFADLATQNKSMAEDRAGRPAVVGRGETLTFELKTGSKVKYIENMPRGAENPKVKKIIDDAKKEGYDAIQFPDRGFETVEGSKRVFDIIAKLGRPPLTTIILNQRYLSRKS